MSQQQPNALERWQARTDTPLLVVSLLFLAALVAPLVTTLNGPARAAVLAVNVGAWLVFAVDYVVRLRLSVDRWRFVRQHPVDLLIVLVPFLRPLRLIRLLRLLRLATVLGVMNKRAARSLHRRVLAYVVGAVAVLVVAAGAAIVEVERDADGANITTFADGLWWAATTVTTVGYGDRFPVTTAGRMVAVGLMVTGIALLGVVTASIAASFVERLRRVEQAETQEAATLELVLAELREVRAELSQLVPVDSARTAPVD